MTRLIRAVLVLTALVLLIFMTGFIIQAPWATVLWPWPDTPLSYLFVGSILAAVALPVGWIGLTGELAALRSGALDFTVSYAGISGFFVLFYPQAGLSSPYTVFAVGGLILNGIIYLLSRRIAFQDSRPMPSLVRGSFLVFALVLIGVGMALVTGQPHIFPWPLKPESSVLVGWIFLGAAVYFLHGVAVPLWHNACGQLLGFLAYDLVLLGPFISHLDRVHPDHRLSLMLYLSVLIYSTLLAVYFLFIHRTTRLIGRQQPPDRWLV